MRKEKDGTYVVNTTTLGADVKGYRGAVPTEVYIKKNKVVKVVLLKNSEGPKYLQMVTAGMLTNFEGKKIDEAVKVDGVTGATYTSEAVKENVRLALDYYKKNK